MTINSHKDMSDDLLNHWRSLTDKELQNRLVKVEIRTGKLGLYVFCLTYGARPEDIGVSVRHDGKYQDFLELADIFLETTAESEMAARV